MNILLVINRVVPVRTYGGVERVVWYLAKELDAMGHRVTMLTARGSHCPYAEVLTYNPKLPLHAQIPDYVDVVHFNDISDPLTTKPYIVSMHRNGAHDNPPERTIYLSQDHAARHGSQHFVYNGLDWDEYGSVNLNRDRSYYHFLGDARRVQSNIGGAIRIARALPNGRLKVIGGHRFSFKMGMRFTLSPRVGFCGFLGGDRKLSLLEGSRGLIYPTTWEEPFGLPIIESLYFGAPIFGTRRGALPELVSEEFGALHDDEMELVRAIREGTYSRARCHQYAMDCFSSRVMTIGYLKQYERVLNMGHM